jgi:hypothetical protein
MDPEERITSLQGMLSVSFENVINRDAGALDARLSTSDIGMDDNELVYG